MAPLAQWQARPDRPYEPASLARDGTVHCVPRKEAVPAAVSRFHRDTAGPLPALAIDQSRLDAPVEWTAPAPGSPLNGTGALLPRIRGPVSPRRSGRGARDRTGRARPRPGDCSTRTEPPARARTSALQESPLPFSRAPGPVRRSHRRRRWRPAVSALQAGRPPRSATPLATPPGICLAAGAFDLSVG
ncbi:DUF952 domain-containing protein [Streptomyces sp. NPDC048045]|uniref:DUF952 domain-containing protein n=1 Tax=Streptomyces sp. NPDC048045 TaxID=3154710 RepID=UPI00341985EE